MGLLGAMTLDEPRIDLAFIDGLAELSHAPDGKAEALAAAYRDPRVEVPDTVFNAVLDRPEPVR